MKEFWVACAVLLVFACWIPPSVKAIQTPDARAACAQFANSRYHQNNPDNFENIQLFPQDLVVEKLDGKIGNQSLSAVLSGTGALRLKKSAPVDIQFTCLLGSEQKTLFFHATPNPSPEPVDSCAAQAATIGEAVPCLEKTLKQEEHKLADLEKRTTNQARGIDQQAKQMLSLSGRQWKQYRDSECIRRLAFRVGGNHPDITEYDCLIGKTRERIRDLAFDQ